mgnify:CR=1 FL=1
MELLNELASLPIFRNSILDWLLALALATGLLLTLLFARRLIRSFHARLKNTPETEFVELPVEILSLADVQERQPRPGGHAVPRAAGTGRAPEAGSAAA